jgi:hypothetical protein
MTFRCCYLTSATASLLLMLMPPQVVHADEPVAVSVPSTASSAETRELFVRTHLLRLEPGLLFLHVVRGEKRVDVDFAGTALLHAVAGSPTAESHARHRRTFVIMSELCVAPATAAAAWGLGILAAAPLFDEHVRSALMLSSVTLGILTFLWVIITREVATNEMVAAVNAYNADLRSGTVSSTADLSP